MKQRQQQQQAQGNGTIANKGVDAFEKARNATGFTDAQLLGIKEGTLTSIAGVPASKIAQARGLVRKL